jgi:Na+-translocating ferredoxin:NAD+ oxidoreductase RnfG subunit
MSKILLRLTLFVAVVVGSAILVTVCGCADSAASSAVQIETVQDVFPSATDISKVSTNRGVQESGRPENPVVNEIRDSSDLLGYSIVSDVVGRSGSFKIQVLLDKQHVVKRATVISYPWTHGRGVGKHSFASQFEGKGPEDAIKIGDDIDAVSGATISCRAMARGVREAIKLLAE